MILTSIAIAECIEKNVKESEHGKYIGNLLMVGKISDKHFIGGYDPGAYSFKIHRVFTHGNQDPKIQWIENRIGWVCRIDYSGRIGRFFIFTKGDFYLID